MTFELPPTATRVPRSTAPEVNARIRMRADAEVARLENAQAVEVDARLEALGSEWDIERTLQANAGALMLAGTLLGWHVDRRFLALPTVVLSFFALHAVQGWCPPVPLFRRRGVRTAREIERERYAIKALRGDFDDVPPPDGADHRARVRAALAAVDA